MGWSLYLFLACLGVWWTSWVVLLSFRRRIVTVATGRCFLERLAASRCSIVSLYDAIQNSPSLVSISSKLREPSAFDLFEVEKEIIKRKISDDPNHLQSTFVSEIFIPHLRLTLVGARRLCALHALVDGLLRTQYSRENPAHEEALLRLWSVLRPSPPFAPLKSRNSKQWQELGFQGVDPATDFRGGGILPLYALLWTGIHSPLLMNRVESLAAPTRSGSDFGVAVVCIHLTVFAAHLLSTRLVGYIWLEVSIYDEKAGLGLFYCLVAELLLRFSVFWDARRPVNIMGFPEVKARFEKYMIELAQRRELGRVLVRPKVRSPLDRISDRVAM